MKKYSSVPRESLHYYSGENFSRKHAKGTSSHHKEDSRHHGYPVLTPKQINNLSFTNNSRTPNMRATLDSSFETNGNTSVQDSFRKNTFEEKENNSPVYRKDLDGGVEEYNPADIKLLKKELAVTKKALNDAQARVISTTKELSKVQHEYSLLHLNQKRGDIRCQELIQKHTEEQTKINELLYMNTQLANENAKLKMEAQNSTSTTRENLEKLKKNLSDVEKLIGGKNANIMKYVKKIKLILFSVQKLLEASEPQLYSNCAAPFDKIEQLCNNILETVTYQKLEELDKIEDMEEYDALKSVNDVVYKYQNENKEMKTTIAQLQSQLRKEQTKTKEVIPQYRESVSRLKKNSELLREKLREFQDKSQIEKNEMIQKIKVLEETRKKINAENYALKAKNNELQQQLREYEDISVSYDEQLKAHQLRNPVLEEKERLQSNDYMAYVTFNRRHRETSPEFRTKNDGLSRRRYEEVVSSNQESRQLNFNNIDMSFSKIHEDSERFPVSANKDKLNNSSLFEYSSKFINTLSGDKKKDSTALFNSFDASNSKINQTDISIDMKRSDAPAVTKKRLFNELPPRSPNLDFRSVETDDQKDVSTEYQRERRTSKKEGSESKSMRTAENSETETKVPSNRGSVNDLRDEIASLDHEIYEIQKCMSYELNQPNC